MYDLALGLSDRDSLGSGAVWLGREDHPEMGSVERRRGEGVREIERVDEKGGER